MMLLLFVTLVSLLVAVVMSVVAWRAAGEERRRSDARVATLAADIHGGDLDLRQGTSDQRIDADEPVPVLVASDGLFATAQPQPSGSRFAMRTIP